MNERKLEDRLATIFIQAPIEDVWNEITATGRIQRPLFNTVLSGALEPGARLRYSSRNGKRVFIAGEVLEVDPPRRFSYTFTMTMSPDLPTTVTWELEPESDGCRVTIIHSGWTTAHTTENEIMTGWSTILDLLKAEIETGQLPLSTIAKYRLMAAFQFMLPPRTSARNATRKGW